MFRLTCRTGLRAVRENELSTWGFRVPRFQNNYARGPHSHLLRGIRNGRCCTSRRSNPQVSFLRLKTPSWGFRIPRLQLPAPCIMAAPQQSHLADWAFPIPRIAFSAWSRHLWDPARGIQKIKFFCCRTQSPSWLFQAENPNTGSPNP